MLWKEINPNLVGAVEKPFEPSPLKMSPAPKMAATVLRNPYAQKATMIPEEENNNRSQMSGKPTYAIHSTQRLKAPRNSTLC